MLKIEKKTLTIGYADDLDWKAWEPTTQSISLCSYHRITVTPFQRWRPSAPSKTSINMQRSPGCRRTTRKVRLNQSLYYYKSSAVMVQECLHVFKRERERPHMKDKSNQFERPSKISGLVQGNQTFLELSHTSPFKVFISLPRKGLVEWM